MPGFNTLPAVGGGGGQANMTFVASIHMQTYNRSWAQGGTPGYYAMYSTNQENGYVYFVGATTTGGPLNRLINVTHSFTRIDVIAPQNDMVSLYKAKVKSTTVFNNPFDAFASFPSVITSSGNFVLPNNALPLVNVVVVGGGGGSGGGHTSHGGGGGGAGGNVVKLTAYQAVGTTGVTIGGGGGGGGGGSGGTGGRTFFGNVYALGGGGGGNHNGSDTNNLGGGANTISSRTGDPSVGNGGGRGAYHGAYYTANTGFTQTSTTGLGTSGSPVLHGGNSGGRCTSNTTGSDSHNVGGGGGGAGGNGGDAGYQSGGNGGAGHISDIEGSNHSYAGGGRGASASGGYSHGSSGWAGYSTRGHGGDASNGTNNTNGGGSGAVIVRYYIP